MRTTSQGLITATQAVAAADSVSEAAAALQEAAAGASALCLDTRLDALCPAFARTQATLEKENVPYNTHGKTIASGNLGWNVSVRVTASVGCACECQCVGESL